VACSLYNALTIDIENWRMNSCPPLRVCFPIDLDLDPDFSTRVDYLACARLGYVDGEYEVEWGGMKRLLIMTVVLTFDLSASFYIPTPSIVQFAA
jgi:hypothetical protein